MRHDIEKGVPVGSFYDLPHSNKNGYLSSKSSEVFLISMDSYPCEIEYVFNISDSGKTFDGQKVIVKIYQDLSSESDLVTEDVRSKYLAFDAILKETILLANASGLNILEEISYENLISSLMMLEGETWVRRALMLQASWQSFLIVCEKDLGASASEVFYKWLPIIKEL